jgi:sugar phosphate isomerase/epimerase
MAQALSAPRFGEQLENVLVSNKWTSIDRRSFLQLASAAYAVSAIEPAFGQMAGVEIRRKFPISLGKVTWVGENDTIDAVVQGVAELGLYVCQIGFERSSLDVVKPLQKACAEYGVSVTAISEHNPGKRIFNFYEGPVTIGIIPAATREVRIRALKMSADIAVAAEVPAIHTHCGFIPEDPNDPIYPQAVAAVKDVAMYCKERGISLLCETGQETPITLLRLIEDVSTGNVFVNLDVANLILYGKGNPVDAMDVIGPLVRGIHAKDGRFPTNPRELGLETPIGEGKVDFPKFFEQLRRVNYRGSMMIEREVGNEVERKRDVLKSKLFLENMIVQAYG